MPRDNDKNNASSRGRRDRPSGGKSRSGAARGPDKKFAKRDFAGKSDGEKRPYAAKSDGGKSYGKKPYSGPGKPHAGKREGPPPRRDGDAPRPRGDRPFADRPQRFNRDDRPRGDDRGGEKRPYTPRGEGFRKDGDRPRGDRPERKFGGDKKFSRGAPDRKSDRGDRKSDRGDRGSDRGDSKPWQKRDASAPDHAGRNSHPPREGARNFDKPRFDKPRYDKPREDRGGGERPRFSRPREDRPQGDRPFRERPKFDRPREGGSSWQEHPRSDAQSFDRSADRHRRDN